MKCTLLVTGLQGEHKISNTNTMTPYVTEWHINCHLGQLPRLTQVRRRTTTLGNADRENKDAVHHWAVSAVDTAGACGGDRAGVRG